MSNHNYCCIRKPHEQSKTSFGVPKIESEHNKWEESLGMKLKKSHRICLQHFKRTDVISNWESGKGINKYSICLKRYRLRNGALPFIENVNEILNETVRETTENINNELVTIPNFDEAPLENTLITSPELKRRKIHPDMPDIKWSFYESVFKHDSKMLVKVCPKITQHHFDLNNLAKMKVKYATQIFSKSMADGITFYKNKKFDGFDECEETIKFTLMMNILFDALNRKFPAEGIKHNSKDLETLKEAIVWLNTWESNVDNNLIDEN